MKFVVAAAFLGCTSAVAAQNVVQMDLNRRAPGQGAPIINRRLGKRATYTEILANNLTGGGYYAVVDVGTPGQQMSMVLDTGSSDAWVVNYKADLCTSLKLQEYYGDSCWETYNPADSSTFQEVDRGGFVITYIDGGGASGDYIKDTFSIGGMTIKGLQMGMANKTVRGSGILGIGFDAGEAASAVYPNLIDQMVSQGLISAKAYSLYLNDRRTSSGTILFGGFDTEKFIGELQVLPILKSTAGSYTAFAVAMSGLSISYANGSTENILTAGDSLPAVLDSGTTLSYLPDDVTAAIVSQLDAYTDERETGLTFINCDYLTSSSSLFFTMAFGSSATITVPAIEMVLDVLDGYTGELPPGIPFNNVCLFGLQGSGSISSQGGGGSAQAQDFALLGDTFLRSAYVVYDLDSAQIGIAQANLNSSDTDIVEIGASDKSIPSASGVASQQTTETAAPAATTGSSTGTGQGSGQVTVTVTPSQSPTKNAAAVARPGGSSAQGPAVMAITGLFALFGGAIFAL